MTTAAQERRVRIAERVLEMAAGRTKNLLAQSKAAVERNDWAALAELDAAAMQASDVERRAYAKLQRARPNG